MTENPLAGLSYITKLKGVSNHPIWKFEVKIFLEAAKVFEIANGTETKPINNERIKTWKNSDALARKVIITTLDKPLIFMLYIKIAFNIRYLKFHFP